MASRSSVVSVKVLVDAAQAKAGLDQTADAAEGFAGKLGKGIVGLAAAAGVTAFAASAVKAASAAEQAAGGVEAVFKSSATKIHEYASSSAKDIGLSSAAYETMATTIGSQFKNAGVSLDELAPKTDKLIDLGADLAAQFGGSTADAVSALSSLLRGERDPIERFGVTINQAAVDAEVLALGLDTSTAAAKSAANQQATLALLYEQTADAQGANAREADTLAGAQARMQATWEDTAAAVGTALLPALSGVAAVLTDLAPAFQAVVTPVAELVGWVLQLPAPLEAAVLAGAGWLAFGGKITDSVKKFTGELKTATASAGGFGGAVGNLGKALGTGLLVGGAVAVLATVVDVFVQAGAQADAAAQGADAYADAIIAAGGAGAKGAQDFRADQLKNSQALADLVAAGATYGEALDFLGGKTNVVANGTDNLSVAYDHLGALAKDNVNLTRDQADAAAALVVEKEAYIAAEERAAAVAGVSAEQMSALTQQVVDAQAAYDAAATAVAKQAVSGDALQASLRQVGAVAQIAGDAAAYLRAKLDELDGRNASLDDTTAAYNAQLTTLTGTFTAAAEAGDLNTQALADWNVNALTANKSGQDVYNTVTGQATAYADLLASTYSTTAATGDLTKAQDDTRAAADNARAKFVEQHDAMGLTEDQAKLLADKLGILEGTKLTDKEFEVLGDDADAQSAVLAANEAEVKDKTLTVTADASAALQTLASIQAAKYTAELTIIAKDQGLGMFRADAGQQGRSVPAGFAAAAVPDAELLGGPLEVGPTAAAPYPATIHLGTITAAAGLTQLVNITVNGALDADGVARQIGDLLTSRQRRAAGVVAGRSALVGAVR